MNNLRGGRVVIDDLQYIDVEEKDFSQFRLNRNDLLFNRTNSIDWVGKTSLFDRDGDYLFASYLIRIVVDTALADPEFLNYYLNADLMQCRLKQPATRGVSQSNISATKLRSLQLPLPPLPEQCAIAHVLRTVQRAKEATEKIIAAARQLKSSLMRHLFTYGPVMVEEADSVRPAETEIGPLPEHWEVVELGDHADLATGGTPSRDNPAYWGGAIPWVKTGEVNYRTIISAGETISQEGLENSNARLFPAGTLLVAMYGQGITRGRVAILGIEATTNQACAAVFPQESLDRDFLYFAFIFGYERIREMGHGANQRNLSMAMLKSVKIPLPPLDEQRTISRLLFPIQKKIEAEEHMSRCLESLFRTMLNHLLTGKLRVKDLGLSLGDT
jgi:type I restriction enzyme S subunit